MPVTVMFVCLEGGMEEGGEGEGGGSEGERDGMIFLYFIYTK